MISILLLLSIVLLLCIVAHCISNRFGVPVLLVFIMLGMLFGSDGLVKIDFDNYKLAEDICSLALVVIIFYGGFSTNWSMARSVAFKAGGLASFGVIVTAGLVGIFCYLVLNFNLLESFLVGAVISSTDVASIFSILRSKKLNLKNNTASLLELESGSNDPLSYMLTVIVLALIVGQNLSGAEIFYLVFAQMFYGIFCGIVIAFLAVFILKRVNFNNSGLDTVFVLAIALFSYSLPSFFSGNGYLSVYIAGIILGNSKIRNKVSLVHFGDGLTGLTQIFLFFSLGLLAFPSQIPQILLPSLIIFLFLTLIARPVAVFLTMLPFKATIAQSLLVSGAGIRGAASIVFAIMAMGSDISLENDLFHIVFCVALFSVTLQGGLFPYLAKKLNMVDDKGDVLKTFNDYQEKLEMNLVQNIITERHPWRDKAISSLPLSPEVLMVMIKREDETLIPKGDTIIRKGDIVIINTPSYYDDSDVQLKEVKINKGHKWEGKLVKQINLPKKSLIIVIKREGGGTVIPRGHTIILEGDVLVLY